MFLLVIVIRLGVVLFKYTLGIFIEFLIISFFACPQIAAEHYLSTYKDKEDKKDK